MAWSTYFLGGLVALAVVFFGVAILHRAWHLNDLRRRVRGKLVLTFDDGPSAITSSIVRSALAREGVPGTFFVTGFRADEHGLQALYTPMDDGHIVGSHGYNHINAWRRPIAGVVDATRGMLAAKGRKETSCLFRPPYGKYTLGTLFVCWLLKTRLVLWTLDCKDTAAHTIRTPQDLADQLIDDDGGVVLLHDLDIKADEFPDRAAAVTRICSALIATARQNNFDICTVADLYQIKH